MAATNQLLTLEQFHEQFDGKKPYYEFRRGAAIQKSMPTRLHSLLQRLLVELLEKAGYEAGQEIELRVNDEWHPVPDVIAHGAIEDPYPTKPVDVVVEILSPSDKATDLLEKCTDYQELGIRAIFVLDPLQKTGWRWTAGSLVMIADLQLPNGSNLPLLTVWQEMDARNKR
ncbi:MAG TPA: Uma2 family endonuclease [Bryobacteraceae bacterium]|nr:Uma2 family endonuclease [Bryobacteraceae bacterium]